MNIFFVVVPYLFILTFAQLPAPIIPLLPTYNPSTHCHDFTLPNEHLTVAICLQRASNKQHPYNLYTAPSFCSTNYPPSGHLLDLFSLSSSSIHILFQSLTNLLNTKQFIPESSFLWIEATNLTQNLTDHSFSCPNSCQSKNLLGKFFILKTRCHYNNDSKPCMTIKQTHWDRAPFICTTNQTIKEKKQIRPSPIRPPPNYSNETIVFYDSTPCIIVRTLTHQYTFCFRRQLCSQSQTSAFCTTKSDAYRICREEKNGSSLLTIENDDEYQLINDIVSRYSNETLLNSNGIIKNKYITRAQWMWIDGIKGLNDTYQWNISDRFLTTITDKYWCDIMTNCSGGKGRDHLVLNIVCQSNTEVIQVCLASRRQSEPGPFICKRALKGNEEPISNYTLLRTALITTTTTTTTTTTAAPVVPVYEKNVTSIYYDEHHCLTVQTHSHLYTFCLRRQNCTLTKAYCTKWSQAKQDCIKLKNQSQLLTIDNNQERTLITDIIDKYFYETRLTFNGSSYPYYKPAAFIWIDGIQQAGNQTYVWKNGLESISEHLWCPKQEWNSTDRDRVILNLSCKKNNSLVCLGSRIEWHPAPYICKGQRAKDQCPISIDTIRNTHSNEMFIVTVNRSTIFITCKHPAYSTEIKMQYQCNTQMNQWELIYENDNFTCPEYEIPPMATTINVTQCSIKPITNSTSLPNSTLSPAIPTPIKRNDCSSSELSSIISQLPTQSRYISSQNLTASSLYYDMKLTCYFNHSIHITYRCDLVTKQWIYVYGNTNPFRTCYPPCSNNERTELLNKYFTMNQQTKFRTKYIQKRKSLYIRCFSINENRWKGINYKCGAMIITKYQWFRLHSCFETTKTTTIMTTIELPTVMVSMTVTELSPFCPPTVAHGSPCEYQTGQYIFDMNGCTRKICPSTSRLCNTIRCPPDRICRVIPCQSCIQTDYLQAVCEYSSEPSLCDFERRLAFMKDYESINRWEQQVIAVIHRYANEQRQKLISPWPVLTIN